ncbi:Structural maintenance of chromosomes protein 1 [Cystobasidiomycetes sp. EMM_F5]
MPVSGLTLSEDDLHEYNRLKGSSSRKAVKERADLEDCERSLKTDTSDLNGLKDKAEQACFKLDKAKTEEASLDERNATVRAHMIGFVIFSKGRFRFHRCKRRSRA